MANARATQDTGIEERRQRGDSAYMEEQDDETMRVEAAQVSGMERTTRVVHPKHGRQKPKQKTKTEENGGKPRSQAAAALSQPSHERVNRRKDDDGNLAFTIGTGSTVQRGQ